MTRRDGHSHRGLRGVVARRHSGAVGGADGHHGVDRAWVAQGHRKHGWAAFGHRRRVGDAHCHRVAGADGVLYRRGAQGGVGRCTDRQAEGLGRLGDVVINDQGLDLHGCDARWDGEQTADRDGHEGGAAVNRVGLRTDVGRAGRAKGRAQGHAHRAGRGRAQGDHVDGRGRWTFGHGDGGRDRNHRRSCSNSQNRRVA